MSKHTYIIPIFVPLMGCPHQCCFCDQVKISGEKHPDFTQVSSIIDNYLTTILPRRNNTRIEVAYYGGSFSGLPISQQKNWLKPATSLLDKKIIDGIRISTRPDYIDANMLAFLQEEGVDTIELGAQSFCADVLENAERGHSQKDTIEAVKLIKEFNIKLGLQLMVGLPEDNFEKSVYSAKQAAMLEPNFVRIYPTLVLDNTKLAQLYLEGSYKPLDIEEAVDICKAMTIIFLQKNIPIARIGLQETTELKHDYVIAGPHHPAFGELVESAIYQDMINVLINELDKPLQGSSIIIFCNANELSKAIGHKKTTKDKLEFTYPQTKIKFKPITGLPPESVGIGHSDMQFPQNIITKKEFIRSCRI